MELTTEGIIEAIEKNRRTISACERKIRMLEDHLRRRGVEPNTCEEAPNDGENLEGQSPEQGGD